MLIIIYIYSYITRCCYYYYNVSRRRLFQVSKEEYDMCRITNPNPRIIAYCDKPYKLMYVTITFRSFTPQPGGLEFQPGQDYYFICEYYINSQQCDTFIYVYRITRIFYLFISYFYDLRPRARARFSPYSALRTDTAKTPTTVLRAYINVVRPVRRYNCR